MDRILEDISKWPIEKRRAKLEEFYEREIGIKPNLDKPKRFTEKLQWRKLYEDDPRMTRCIDKLTFKQYIREKLGEGYTAPLIDVWHNPDDVNLSDVPNRSIIKSNCSGATNFVLPVIDKKDVNLIEKEKEIKASWFDRRYLNTNSFFRAYYPINPCVLVEGLVSDSKSGVDEYKFLCFEGSPLYVYYAGNRFEKGERVDHPTLSIFDMDWNNLGVQYGEYVNDPNVRRPTYMKEMIEICRILAKDFSFVRIDFYETKEKIYLSEMTFTWGKQIPFHPDSFDYELGEKWNYPVNQML